MAVSADERIDRLKEEIAELAKFPGPWTGVVYYRDLTSQPDSWNKFDCCSGGHESTLVAYNCAYRHMYLKIKRLHYQIQAEDIVWHVEMEKDPSGF